jgi:phosphate transport system substrate-binding protein
MAGFFRGCYDNHIGPVRGCFLDSRSRWRFPMNLRHLVVLLACCLPLSCAPHPDDVTLQGSGATFPAPIYKRWFLEIYHADHHVRINYQAIGSGAGVRQFIEGLTHFGASDAAMSDAEMKRAREERPEKSDVLLMPMTAGSVAVCYKLPGVPRDKTLKLSRTVLIEIVLGRITEWDDLSIRALNPTLTLPSLPITWIRRSDGSGTTYAVTNHFSAINPEWKERIGVNKSVSWPVGLGAKGNNGIAALIEQTPGALGYVEYGYADLAKLPMAALQNKAGNYVTPSLESGQAALAGAKMPENFRLFIPDPAGEKAYPIVTYTWMLVLKRYSNPKVAATIKKALRYGLTKGQEVSEDLGYIPLPENVRERILKAVEQIQP